VSNHARALTRLVTSIKLVFVGNEKNLTPDEIDLNLALSDTQFYGVYLPTQYTGFISNAVGIFLSIHRLTQSPS
jgi:hypothetical protein